MPIKNAAEIKMEEQLSAQYIFRSDFYEIKNWSFDFKGEKKLNSGFNDCFCIVLVKNGSFHFDLASRPIQMHTGHVIIEKANYEYKLRPTTGECTIFNFTDGFYQQMIHDFAHGQAFFFSNPNILSVLLNSSPEIDYLHHQIMNESARAGKLEMDTLVLSLVQEIAGCITNKKPDHELAPSLRKHHLSTIERAKDFMHNHFMDNISLTELADYCHVSPFHFSRIFKKFTTYSPHQYLLNIRLKHAEILLQNTNRTVMDICFSSGFNSINHFATVVRQKYSLSPRQLRKP